MALAVVVALLDVIPMIGATLGAVVVIAIGFATDPKIGLFCLIFYVAYQQFENYVIYPARCWRSPRQRRCS
jgi:predicted PurR-regulated permease PerM